MRACVRGNVLALAMVLVAGVGCANGFSDPQARPSNSEQRELQRRYAELRREFEELRQTVPFTPEERRQVRDLQDSLRSARDRADWDEVSRLLDEGEAMHDRLARREGSEAEENSAAEGVLPPPGGPVAGAKGLFLVTSWDELRRKARDRNKGNVGISPAEMVDQIQAAADQALRQGKRFREPVGAGGAGVAKAFYNQAIATCFLYGITGERKYYERALQIVDDVTGWERWNHIYKDLEQNSLDRSAIMGSIALCYNWLGDALAPDVSQRWRTALMQKGVEPVYRARQKNKWPFSLEANNNHYAASVAGLGLSSLAIVGDEPRAEAGLQAAIEAGRTFVEKSSAPDGGYPESVLYGCFALQQFYMFSDALRTSRGTDLTRYDNRGWLREFNVFVLYSMYPDLSTPVLFNDQPPNFIEVVEQLVRCTRLFAKTDLAGMCQTQLQNLHRVHPEAFPANPFLFLDLDPGHPTHPLRELPRFKVFGGVGQAFYRKDWDDPASLFMAFKAGTHRPDHMPTNEAHLHYDGGQFVLVKDGNTFVTDPGYQVGAEWQRQYEATEGARDLTRSSVGHAAMLFDDKGQDAFEARLAAHAADADALYLRLELADCYRAVGLSRYTREFVFVEGDLLTVDTFSGGELGRFTYTLPVTSRQVRGLKQNVASVRGSTFQIDPYAGRTVLQGRVLAPQGVSIQQEDVAFKAGAREVTARFLRERGTARSGTNTLINVLSPSGTDYRLQDNGDHWFIEGYGRRVYLAKGERANLTDRRSGTSFTGRALVLGAGAGRLRVE